MVMDLICRCLSADDKLDVVRGMSSAKLLITSIQKKFVNIDVCS